MRRVKTAPGSNPDKDRQKPPNENIMLDGKRKKKTAPSVTFQRIILETNGLHLYVEISRLR